MWGSLGWHTLRQLAGSPRGRETEDPLRIVLFLELSMLPPGKCSLASLSPTPPSGEYSLILIVLWVGFCGQISCVHKEDWQAPSNYVLGYPTGQAWSQEPGGYG